jgi:hypothetical protein
MNDKQYVECGWLTDAQLDGSNPVRIYKGREFVGVATILRVNSGDRHGVHARVEFHDTKKREDVWVFGSDQ